METVRLVRDLHPFHQGVFVPTMGALHAGHRALIEHARRRADHAPIGRRPVVVSVFVNPTQFNDPKDFERYPRTLAADAAICADAGADALFAPSVDEVYPPSARPDPQATPLPPVATQPGLEDAHRPGHFAGVYRVCKRLFEMVRPVAAVFGEKDWQQLALIRAMADSLAHAWPGGPIEIIGHPTIREADGLAMSSRNTLLKPSDRQQAVALSRAMIEAGAHADPAAAEQAGLRVLLAAGITPEYFVVRDGQTLCSPVKGQPCRVLVAARVGDVRLIDNAPWPGFRLQE